MDKIGVIDSIDRVVKLLEEKRKESTVHRTLDQYDGHKIKNDIDNLLYAKNVLKALDTLKNALLGINIKA